ncbi:MAG TPA: DUF3303 family protein [Nitrososphaeraceae archaeon]|jgi:hypothetical protein
MPSQLYGIYGEHTQEACPLYNHENRRWVLANVSEQEKNAQKFGVKILQQYHSALEHTFLWIAEAQNPHLIEDLMARSAGRFNTVRIVPLITFQTVVERCQKIEEGTFFEN